MSSVSKRSLKEKIAKYEPGEAIETMFELLAVGMDRSASDNYTDHYDKLILLSGQLSGIEQQIQLAIVDDATARQEKSRISFSLLTYINDLPAELFNPPKKSPVAAPLPKPVALRAQVDAELSQDQFAFDVFLSYAGRDVESVRLIWEELRGYGLRVFLSKESLQATAGESFFSKIQFALTKSEHFVLVSTPNSMSSEWVKSEYETFFNEFFIPSRGARKFILLKGENFSPALVPVFLRRLQQADKPQQIVQQLVDEVVEQKVAAPTKPKVQPPTPAQEQPLPAPMPQDSPPDSADAYAKFLIDLNDFLATHQGKSDFYLDPQIPANKLTNGRNTCQVPWDHPVMALIDTTVFGSAKNCLLFGVSGIYYHNDWTGQQPGGFHIPYADFLGRSITKVGVHEVSLDRGAFVDFSGSSLPTEEALRIMQGLGEVVKKHF
ncbi:MAG: TIR domain-containing protein [Saprospiraceae bacterium]